MTIATSTDIHGGEAIKGRFASFTLRSTSYYPVDKVMSRIALNLYGVDLQSRGLLDSQKYREDSENHNAVSISTPLLGASKVEGVFLLFLPEGKPAWGLMDIQKIESRHSGVNLSLVSPLALMPHQLHVVGGGIYEHKAQFSVVDREGSTWTLHCDTL